MSDKKDSTTSLGYSKVLSVKDSVGPPIPDVRQRPKQGSKIPSVVTRQDSGDVFPDNPLWTKELNHADIDEHEVSSWVFKSTLESCDAETLAGSSTNDKVN
jgi:hypothetical protein